MDKKILNLLARDSRTTPAQIATMLGRTEDEVRSEIAVAEKEGVIRGYKAVVDWEKLDNAYVSAIIQLRVTPKAGCGFEEVAEQVARYPEVEAVYLMSGVYDLSVIVRGKTFQEVALFVARELSPMESVVETSTCFVLRRYKEMDVELHDRNTDDRDTFLL